MTCSSPAEHVTSCLWYATHWSDLKILKGQQIPLSTIWTSNIYSAKAKRGKKHKYKSNNRTLPVNFQFRWAFSPLMSVLEWPASHGTPCGWITSPTACMYINVTVLLTTIIYLMCSVHIHSCKMKILYQSNNNEILKKTAQTNMMPIWWGLVRYICL